MMSRKYPPNSNGLVQYFKDMKRDQFEESTFAPEGKINAIFSKQAFVDAYPSMGYEICLPNKSYGIFKNVNDFEKTVSSCRACVVLVATHSPSRRSAETCSPSYRQEVVDTYPSMG